MNVSKLVPNLVDCSPKTIKPFTEGVQVKAFDDSSLNDFRNGLLIEGPQNNPVKAYSMIDAFIAATGTKVEDYTPEFAQEAQKAKTKVIDFIA